MTSSHPLPVPCQRMCWLTVALDRRFAPRLTLLFLGAVLARGRRTVTTRIGAAKLSAHYQRCYVAVAAAGKRADRIARRLLAEVARPLLNGDLEASYRGENSGDGRKGVQLGRMPYAFTRKLQI